MTRRELIALLGSTAAMPVGVRAQQPERMRRIGVLQGLATNDPEGQARFEAFLQALHAGAASDARVALKLHFPRPSPFAPPTPPPISRLCSPASSLLWLGLTSHLRTSPALALHLPGTDR
jgi:hypothetical protein